MKIVLHGTPETKRKVHLLYRKRHGSSRSSLSSLSDKNNDSSSEDDFEKEMNKELNDTVASMEASIKIGNSCQLLSNVFSYRSFSQII